jgi:phosphomannomutase
VARVIADTFTFENVRYCAEGVARYLEAADLRGAAWWLATTRAASDDFARATAEVVAAHGIDVWLFDRPAPTPVGCYAVVEKRAGGAVMITASHNRVSTTLQVQTDAGQRPAGDRSEIEAGLDQAQLKQEAGRGKRQRRKGRDNSDLRPDAGL